MPTYEYRCAEGHHFEQLQRMAEPPVEKCPVCGAKAERLLSAGAGLLFKGSGFYITDYRSDSYKKEAAAESGKSGDVAKGGPEKGGAEKGGSEKAKDSASAKPETKSDPGAKPSGASD